MPGVASSAPSLSNPTSLDARFDDLTARSALHVLVCAGVATTLPILFRPDAAQLYFAQGGALLVVASLLYAARRRLPVRLLTRVALATGAAVTTASAWVSGGSASAVYHTYSVAMVAAAFIALSPRAATVATLAVIALGGFLATATARQWIPTPWVVHSPSGVWLTTSTACVIVGVVQWLEVHRLREMSKALQRELLRSEETQLRRLEGERALAASQIALKQSLSLLQGAFESTADGLAVVDAAGHVSAYNQKFLTLWRLPENDVREAPAARVEALMGDQVSDPDTFHARLAEIANRPDGVSFDTITCKDGRVFERFSQPQFVDAAAVGRVFSFHDVTIRAAEDRRRSELERQLQQAHTMEALGTMAGGVAHDFNNLLAIILGHAEGAQTAEHAAARSESLRGVVSAVERASALVKEIRDFSRPRATERTVTGAAPTIASAVRLLQVTLPRAIDVAVELDPHVTMFANPTQVQQVVTNLVLNAGQAIGGAAGRIRVELTEVAADETPATTPHPRADRYAKLTVADTGQGIESDVMPRVFDPFFTTKEKTAGSGLGLAVVQNIVRRHHGTVAVDSTPGAGTEFRVYWPALAPAVAGSGDEPADSAEPPTSGSERHVMMVDDEAEVIRVVAQGLRRLGYQVSTFTDAREALAAFGAAPSSFDVVLTDLAMPHMSGVVLGRRMLELRPLTPIVLFTGYSAELSEDEARAAGFTRVLHKPMTLAALSEALHRIVAPAYTR